jgi:hypothetical protein
MKMKITLNREPKNHENKDTVRDREDKRGLLRATKDIERWRRQC